MRADDVGRSEVEDVMSASEFQYPKSIMERIGDQIGEWLDGLFGRLPFLDVPGGAFAGGVGSLVGWLLVVLALSAVVVVVVLVVRRWVPRAPEDSDGLSEVELEHRRAAGEWAEEAVRHEAAGEWKLAVRARYRELVRALVDRSQLEDLAGRTPGEFCGDMAHTTPAAAGEFAEATLLFELPWYADADTAAVENARLRACAAAVLAAPVEHRLSDAPTPRVGRVVVGAADER